VSHKSIIHCLLLEHLAKTVLNVQQKQRLTFSYTSPAREKMLSSLISEALNQF
jgi:hypothetical protein